MTHRLNEHEIVGHTTGTAHGFSTSDARDTSATTGTVPIVSLTPTNGTPARVELHDVHRYIKASTAESTRRGYRSDWDDFTSWCAKHQHSPLPATPDTVAAYLAAVAGYGAKPGTIARRRSSIRFAHLAAHQTDPTADQLVVKVLAGIRRTHGTRPDQARPILLDQLGTMIDRIDHTDPIGVRDITALTMGWWGAFRRSELCDLTVEQVTDTGNALAVFIAHSKTDQESAGTNKVLPAWPDRTVCAVTAYRAWQELHPGHGPMLRGFTKHRTLRAGRLGDTQVNEIVKRWVAAIGENPDEFSAHSLRAGFVTEALGRGASDRSVMTVTGHRDPRTLGVYHRPEDLLREHPMLNT